MFLVIQIPLCLYFGFCFLSLVWEGENDAEAYLTEDAEAKDEQDIDTLLTAAYEEPRGELTLSPNELSSFLSSMDISNSDFMKDLLGHKNTEDISQKEFCSPEKMLYAQPLHLGKIAFTQPGVVTEHVDASGLQIREHEVECPQSLYQWTKANPSVKPGDVLAIKIADYPLYQIQVEHYEIISDDEQILSGNLYNYEGRVFMHCHGELMTVKIYDDTHTRVMNISYSPDKNGYCMYELSSGASFMSVNEQK